VEHQVRALADHLGGIVTDGRERNFYPLFAHFLRDALRTLGQKPRGIAAVGLIEAALGDHPFERGQKRVPAGAGVLGS
jgi:hypothetical protein